MTSQNPYFTRVPTKNWPYTAMNAPPKPSKTLKRVWRRVRKLSKILGITVGEARKTYKNLTRTQKEALDTTKIFQTTVQEPPKTTRRPSKGNPNLLVRAGAPNEYIQTAPKPAQVTIESLKELKKLCKTHFEGDWNLLAEYANTLGDILKDLE